MSFGNSPEEDYKGKLGFRRNSQFESFLQQLALPENYVQDRPLLSTRLVKESRVSVSALSSWSLFSQDIGLTPDKYSKLGRLGPEDNNNPNCSKFMGVPSISNALKELHDKGYRRLESDKYSNESIEFRVLIVLSFTSMTALKVLILQPTFGGISHVSNLTLLPIQTRS
eukprot:CAMPEP_0115042858 /NCGR_PEP_ID=MMETSP0216-20121206/46519_1 /TAXON_ID=223996 /ORGANISM="Protocruzia adherens, Strain Boccale" /LENGTH=168 /DNA_ID=CAMNT_0002425059 /DNA_START=384 /DNA_END=891 /DNA_ORIENTATION=+